MINSIEDLRSAGVLPSGPVSAWPQERNVAGPGMQQAKKALTQQPAQPKVKPGLGKMAKGLARTAGQAFVNGRVSAKVREKRYDICKACPAFRPDDKRCSECGCFMEAKTWVGGDPDRLCPLAKWPE